MTLASMLLKAGIATAGTGIYLFFRRAFKKAKQTTHQAAEKIETGAKKLETKVVKAKKKATPKPRPKKVPVRAINA